MTIAIVSIVAPKLRSVDTKMLIGSDPRYVTFFVKVGYFIALISSSDAPLFKIYLGELINVSRKRI